MARIRSIKPEAFTSETLSALPVLLRWTFAGLWTYADDDGRAKANAGLIKAAVWPLDDDVTPAHIAAFLDQLEGAGIVCRYEVDGKQYLHVVNFAEHQHPNRPVPSKLPACTRRIHGGLSAPAVSAHPKPPPDSPDGAAANAEAATPPEPATEGEGAGQGTRTEDAVSTHGTVIPKSSAMPPTPLRNELGEVDGVGVGVGAEIPPSAGAAKPRAAAVSEAHVGTVVGAYVDGATDAGLSAPPTKLRARVGKDARQLAAEGWPLAFLVECARRMGAGEFNDLAVQVRKDNATANGRGVVTDRRQAVTDQKFGRAMARAAERDAREGRE